MPVETAGNQSIGSETVNVMGAVDLSSQMLLGDYVMQIVITDNKAKGESRTSTQLVQFEVTE
jgi:hypothetical protein